MTPEDDLSRRAVPMTEHYLRWFGNGLTEEEARHLAAARFGCCSIVETEEHPHPRSIGDTVATIKVTRDALTVCGYGYSGLAPLGASVWKKALADLLAKDPLL